MIKIQSSGAETFLSPCISYVGFFPELFTIIKTILPCCYGLKGLKYQKWMHNFFQKSRSHAQNPSCQKAEMKQISHWQHQNTRHHRKRNIRLSDLASSIHVSLCGVLTVLPYVFMAWYLIKSKESCCFKWHLTKSDFHNGIINFFFFFVYYTYHQV
jgi:hypothetical protein